MSDAPVNNKVNANRTPSLDRRGFLGAGGALALGMMFGGRNMYAEEFVAAPGDTDKGPVDPVGCAVIGLGEQGRAILTALTNVPGADVKYICDHYEGIHARSQEIFPKATAVTEFKKVLDDKAVQAVWIATPTHLHKDLVLAVLQAGKHVYCEAPLAHSIDDARVIAKAAQAAEGLVFHSGLQQRTNPQHKHVLTFVRTGALGKVALGRAHWHRRMSWRRGAGSAERQKALNWRLAKATSNGLMGEVGIHQIDVASWYLKALPVAVTGFGGIMAWDDGRDVQDTVQCVFEYPKSIQFSYEATLASSYDSNCEILMGNEASVMVRDYRAWMFKEADAPALGWEVYAYKEKVGDDTGIALVADATKILAAGKQPGENREVDPKRTPAVCASEAFLTSIREKKKSACDALAGFQATVTALKAHEATMTGTKIVFQKEWFEI